MYGFSYRITNFQEFQISPKKLIDEIFKKVVKLFTNREISIHVGDYPARVSMADPKGNSIAMKYTNL